MNPQIKQGELYFYFYDSQITMLRNKRKLKNEDYDLIIPIFLNESATKKQRTRQLDFGDEYEEWFTLVLARKRRRNALFPRKYSPYICKSFTFPTGDLKTNQFRYILTLDEYKAALKNEK